VRDSIHRLCVTGFFEKNFYRLLFTPPPLSSRHPILHWYIAPAFPRTNGIVT
jgi:hypothetical protein